MASAQTFDAWSTYDLEQLKAEESPQNVALELRFGPYIPKLNNELNWGPHTFGELFVEGINNAGEPYDPKKRVCFAVEADWQALRIPYFGSFGPGFSIGYTKMEEALQEDAPEDGSGPAVSLTIVPMYVVGVLRADVLARHTPVPLVPYGKLGVGLAQWSLDLNDAAKDAGFVTEGTSAEAESPSAGYQTALGIMLYLDPIDRNGDRMMENNFGVNSTYVFLEWYNSELDGFGSGDDLNVGTNTWFLGVAMEI